VCIGQTRLIDLEPYPDRPKSEALTFECRSCGSRKLLEVPVGNYAGPEEYGAKK
jgi:hypothetical protein